MKNLEAQYLTSLKEARARVDALADPDSRAALEAVLVAVGHLHRMLMTHESATSKALFDMEGRMQNVLFNT